MYGVTPFGARWPEVVNAASGCRRISKLVAVESRAMEFSICQGGGEVLWDLVRVECEAVGALLCERGVSTSFFNGVW